MSDKKREVAEGILIAVSPEGVTVGHVKVVQGTPGSAQVCEGGEIREGRIICKSPTQAYRDNYDSIFGKKNTDKHAVN